MQENAHRRLFIRTRILTKKKECSRKLLFFRERAASEKKKKRCSRKNAEATGTRENKIFARGEENP